MAILSARAGEGVANTAGRKTLLFTGYTADLSGPPLQLDRGCLKYWHDAASAASWKVTVNKPCLVEVEVLAAVQAAVRRQPV